MKGTAPIWMGLSVATAPLAAQTPAVLAGQRYDVDPQHSSIEFTARILGVVPVRGRFRMYEGTVIYDPAHPERASVSAVIDAASITTDMEFRDNHLRSPDFLDTARYHTIEFRSERVTRSADSLRIEGILTMHGVSQPVTLPARIVLEPDTVPSGTVRVAFEAELRVSRAAFGIAGTNQYNPGYNPATTLLSDGVDISVDVFAIRDGYRNRSLGTGAPPGVADTLLRTIEARGVRAAVSLYRSLVATRPSAFNYRAGQLDLLGHVLAERGRLQDALAIFQLDAEVHGDVPGVLESLGEAQALANDGAGALATFRRALEQRPGSTEAREMIRHLEAPQAR